MWPNPQETADLVTFTEEILNGNFIFCAVKALKVGTSASKKVLQEIWMIAKSL